jgi:hypothetical protein
MASCFALISFSLAALFEGKESMKLVRSRSLASSSSNFSLETSTATAREHGR